MGDGSLGGGGGFAQAVFQAGGEGFEQGVGGAVLEDVERGDAGGHGQGIARERAGLVDGPGGRDLVHQVGAAAVSADGQTAADDLAQAGEVGLDAVEPLRPAQADAEAGHHFIEDEQRPVLVAQGAKALEVAGRGGHDADVAADRARE